MYNSFSDAYIRISTLLEEFVLYFTGQTSLNNPQALDTIIENSINFTKSDLRLKRVIYLLLGIGSLILYSVLGYYFAEDTHKLLATVTSIYIVTADLMYEHQNNFARLYLFSKFADQTLMNKANGIVMIIYRASASVTENYWVLGHSIGYIAVGLMFMSSILHIM